MTNPEPHGLNPDQEARELHMLAEKTLARIAEWKAEHTGVPAHALDCVVRSLEAGGCTAQDH
jgi:hypothetical protein